ncbi:Hint domain-containing protein [Cognatiyoonia koreensis]|uniref:Hint domain-containing protein n=1 Tax=Cognatiyoonia koreensis TaxID=364200 RepID=A0A1I0NQG5_9RHOB|nr:Hint domain-containing protein [Cognatiyoonia koreensis]SEW03818.1 Hint domain-containing protein [Cognatiyoonia koreensis]
MQLGTIDTAAAAAVKTTQNSGVCTGTTIMTLEGETPVEHLSVGDRIITRDSGMAILKGIRMTSARIAPIRIKAGSLGHTRPDRDMIVAPGARIHIRDWRAEAIFGAPTAMVQAQQLVDGEYLAVQEAREMNTFELIFERQHIIYADGIEMVTSE